MPSKTYKSKLCLCSSISLEEAPRVASSPEQDKIVPTVPPRVVIHSLTHAFHRRRHGPRHKRKGECYPTLCNVNPMRYRFRVCNAPRSVTYGVTRNLAKMWKGDPLFTTVVPDSAAPPTFFRVNGKSGLRKRGYKWQYTGPQNRIVTLYARES